MKARVLFLAIVMLTFLLPGAVLAQQFFDYVGMTMLPAAEGEAATMYATVGDPAPATTPLPLDFANYEYTIVVTDLTLVSDAFPELYAGGTITLYQDDATVADYAAPGTFTDGEALLVGTVTLDLFHMADVMPGNLTGSGTGNVDWTGGTHLNDFAPEDQTGWTFVVASNSGSGLLEEGYDEVWDGKVEPDGTIVDTDKASWDEVKGRWN